jgi:hypothetical protein
MRQIELKTVELEEKFAGLPDRLDYREQLLQLLKIPVEGLTIDAMELPLRILSKLRQANGSVRLEEAEFKYLLDTLNAMQFRYVFPELVAMRDAVRDAPEVIL